MKSRTPGDESPLLSLPFDHYERHVITRAIAGVIRGHVKRPQLKVLDVGGAPASLPQFLPQDHVLTVDLEALHSEGHLRADGTALPFRDGVFDIVTCHDTLEHVPSDRREAFLLELMRVTGDFLIINGPFSDPKVEAAERLVAQLVRDTVGEGHPTLHFLGEHAELGLPALEETLALIDRLGFLRAVVSNGPLDEWVLKMMIKHHLSALAVHGLRPYEFDRLSNEAYLPAMSAGSSYRQAVIASKRNEADLLHLIQEKLRPHPPGQTEDRDVTVSLDTVNEALGIYLSLLQDQLEDKDRHIANIEDALAETQAALVDRDQHIANIETLLADKDGLLTEKDGLLAEKESRIASSEALLAQTEEQLRQVRQQYQVATSTLGFRLLERARAVINRLAPPGTRRRGLLRLLKRALRIVRTEGWRAFVWRAVRVWRWAPRMMRRAKFAPQVGPLDEQYQLWLNTHALTPARLRRIRKKAAQLDYRPLVSIVMPVYNPDPAWLRDAIESVRAQLYDNWELCIADDGSTRPGVRELLEEGSQADMRIRVTYLEKNRGIVAASNAALALARGEFVGFLDHDDELKPDALFEVVKLLNERQDLDYLYSDEDKKDPDGRLVEPFFKPDWSPDLLMSVNYVTHFSVFRKEVVDRVGGFRKGYDGSQDYDLILRVTEVTDHIAHISKALYTWRKVTRSSAASEDIKRFANRAAKRALKDALKRRGLRGEVTDGLWKGRYRVKYKIERSPRVAIIIPTRDRVELLRRCVESIYKKSSYRNYEVIIVDNNSEEPETLEYLSSLKGRVIRYPHRFNFSKMVNLAAREADCDAILLLNNDTEVIAPDWIEAMLEHCQRPEVAAVGARLLYPDGRAQHEGIIMGLAGGCAGNVDHGGYFALGACIHNCSAVTAACVMIRPSVFWELGGFEERLGVAFNDVDFCLRARDKGYLIVYTPHAVLYHYEGGTRGKLHPTKDEQFFRNRWGNPGQYRDPYYNPNLDLLRPFTIRL